jgi:hypothetical protein
MMAVATAHKRRTGWLVYAGLLTLAVVVGEWFNIYRGGGPDAVTLANWLLSATLLTALWCHALQKPLGDERYWRVVFWILLFANLLMLVPVLMGGGPVALFTAALSLLVVPAYVAAYRYAYRSPGVWGREG